MDIIIALNSVITVMRRTHVRGEESADFAVAIDLLTKSVHALQDAKNKAQEEAEQHDYYNEQREDFQRQLGMGDDQPSALDAGSE